MCELKYFLLLLGGIAFFLFGLKFMSENTEDLCGDKMQKVIKTFTGNRFSSVLTGALSTAVLQSSVATNVIIVGFTSSGILSFYSACALVMGSNIGTTVTAQLVALSGSSGFDITAIGSLIAFIGFIFTFTKSQKLQKLGMIMAGFGMLFFGLDVISDSIAVLKNNRLIRSFFLVKNPFLLLLNGMLITAIVQSSSAVTGVMIVLATNGLIGFDSSIFLILGANIGCCFSVIIASKDKPIHARAVAFFNLLFNVFGTALMFLPLAIFKEQIANAFLNFSGGVERAIANFHTLFNTIVCLVVLPMLKGFSGLAVKLTTPKPNKRSKTALSNIGNYREYV